MIQAMDTKPKVLYVDDEEENCLVFRSSFRRHYDILTANSAYEALGLLKENHADVIISDQRMPDISGVEFLSRLPDTNTNIRMILTGFSDIGAVVDALNSGKVYKYITKPWEKDELLKVIEEAIENLHRQEQHPAPAHPVNGTKKAKQATPEAKADPDVLQRLKMQIEESNRHVQLLGEIGQEITSTLDLDTILNAVYENVNQLMDAYSFGIGIYNSQNNTIDYQLAIENAARFTPYTRSMENKNQFPVWCIENRKEVFINDVENEYEDYITNLDMLIVSATREDGRDPEFVRSLIYMPLMSKEKVIGLISVQSLKKNAYGEFHLNTVRNIGIFVATALENARAYKLIEEQKREIEQKNIELEHKVTQRTEELRRQKDELEDTFTKLKLLTEVGQEITSTLHLDTILNTIYENINRLMDASIFGIGIFNADSETIDYRLAIENGKRYQPYTRTMEDKNQFPVWCIENKKEIFINDVYKEYSRYISQYKDKEIKPELEDGTKVDDPLSFIYIPLVFNNKPIGVLSVQSFRKFAYNEYHLDILRSLASYITTAIQNAGSYSRMTLAFEQLKATQSKLVESEKMASLGVLTAGVAHEINNPVNFISGGIQSLEENYKDLKQLLQLTVSYAKKTDEALKNEIGILDKKLQTNTMLVEMDDLIASIKSGAKRTAEIVKGLRNFSRLDESDKKKARMEEGLDNTLVILNNRFKNRIKITRDYGKTPEIMCFPGQLNQVFMNLLYNAADAITGEGEITIRTWEENNQIIISIKDTGTGMTDEVKNKIFEPFFTTKPVGKGTGLGLSISYGIIDKHRGSIEVSSEPGKGTEFIITLPIQL
jgi:signal transduction histidine kinase/CheY-like chemotaxis protein